MTNLVPLLTSFVPALNCDEQFQISIHTWKHQTPIPSYPADPITDGHAWQIRVVNDYVEQTYVSAPTKIRTRVTDI